MHSTKGPHGMMCTASAHPKGIIGMCVTVLHGVHQHLGGDSSAFDSLPTLFVSCVCIWSPSTKMQSDIVN